MMRCWTGAAFVLACATSALAAQDAPAASSSRERITVTGCVERADQVVAVNVGTTVDSLTFVLVKAEEGRADDPPVKPSTAPASDFDKSYRLDADVDAINPHVGHRVEIVGVLAPAAGNVPVGTSGTTPSGAPPPTLKVESVKMLSATCGR